MKNKIEFGANKTEATFDEVMGYESLLPEEFDGVFKFTNPSDEEFSGTWGKKQYLFPPRKTVPMIMVDYSPLEIQHIRKKFAKNLAEREFYKSKEYKLMTKQEGDIGNKTMTGIQQAAAYTLDDLTPYIQACLEPMEVGQASYSDIPSIPIEEKLHTDNDGKTISRVIDGKDSLVEKAKLNQ